MKMFQKSSSSFKSVSLMPSLATKNKNPIASIKKSDIKTTYNEQTKIHTRIKPHYWTAEQISISRPNITNKYHDF